VFCAHKTPEKQQTTSNAKKKFLKHTFRMPFFSTKWFVNKGASLLLLLSSIIAVWDLVL